MKRQELRIRGTKMISLSRFGDILALLLITCLLIIATVGCSSSDSVRYAQNPVAERETLTQVSTIDALLAGVYDGVISCGQLKEYGDFGIGTFEALDGEMIVLEGEIYQVKADGVAYQVPDSLGVPFAAVTFFDSDYKETLSSSIDYAGFQIRMDDIIPSKNIFFAMKLDGSFSYVKTRSVPKQEKPYPVLAEVAERQPVFEFNNVTGTIIGFRCPDYVEGINVPGYHLHFLTSDGKAGGHVLKFTVQQAVIAIDYTSGFLMVLPGGESDFHKLDLSQDKQSELEKVEK
ncbi:acetolactate decarboxylase [Chloroflexota bacterium]